MIDPVQSDMATSTAPYYQPARNLSYPNGHNGTTSYEPQAEDYELAASAAPHAPMYAGITTNGAELSNGSHGQQHQQQHYQHPHFGQAVTSDERTMNSTPELAGLLQAVTSAVGQEQEQQQNGTQGQILVGEDVYAQNIGEMRKGEQTVRDTFANAHDINKAQHRKRKRGSLTEQNHLHQYEGMPEAMQSMNDVNKISPYPQRKRTRRTAHSLDQTSTAIAAPMSPNGTHDGGMNSGNLGGSGTNFPIHDSNPTALGDARAAGVHSAAALFRQTTNSSRKYTRPPMSQLFYSLQLNAESFLHLQAAAKTYMLDPTHPERQNCVGNRGKGDNDMVKLRLFNCVRDFLTDGIGEKFFGETAPGRVTYSKDGSDVPIEIAANKDKCFTWPRDGNKIVSLVTPLMRRMVTNERQRMYAIETRKGGGGSGSSTVSTKRPKDAPKASPISFRSASELQTFGEETPSHILQSAALDAIAHDTGQSVPNDREQQVSPRSALISRGKSCYSMLIFMLTKILTGIANSKY